MSNDNERDDSERPTEAPATWENVAVGKGEEIVGKLFGDKQMVDEGEDQVEAAHEVRAEYREGDEGELGS